MSPHFQGTSETGLQPKPPISIIHSQPFYYGELQKIHGNEIKRCIYSGANNFEIHVWCLYNTYSIKFLKTAHVFKSLDFFSLSLFFC